MILPEESASVTAAMGGATSEDAEEDAVEDYLARLSSEAEGMEDNYEQLVSDLERHLGEFHSNGDLLEDAVDKAKAADASGASAVSSSSTSDTDLSHLLASCRSSLDLVTHYHERVRAHPTKGKGQRTRAKGGQRSRAPSYAEVAAFGERVAGE